MVAILTAAKEIALTESILREYYGQEFSQEMLSRYVDPKNTCVIAVEDGRAFGLAGCRSGSIGNFLVDNAFTLDDAPEGTFEVMMRSLMAIAQNNGSEVMDIHAPDPTGDNIDRCYRMGFEDSGPCTCCQRSDLMHMRFRFRSFYSIRPSWSKVYKSVKRIHIR